MMNKQAALLLPGRTGKLEMVLCCKMRALFVLALAVLLTATGVQAQTGGRPRGEPVAWLRYTLEAESGVQLPGNREELREGDSPAATVHAVRGGLSFPVFMSETVRAFSGIHAASHYFRFSDLAIDDIEAYDLSIPFNVMMPLSRQWRLMGLFTPGIHSDLRRVNHRDIKTAFLAMATYSYSPQWTFTMGSGYSRIFGDDSFFPVVGATWQPNEQWSVNLSFPRPGVVYTASEKLRLRAGMQPAGGKWNIADPRRQDGTGGEYDFEFKGWHFGGGVEYDLTANLAVDFSAGGTLRRKYTIENDREKILGAEADGAFGVYLGLAWRR